MPGRHYIPGPAFGFSSPQDTQNPRGAMPAIVLRCYSSPGPGAPDWYRGPVCSVLFLETYGTAENVIVLGGGGARQQTWSLPAETDREIADDILLNHKAPQFTDENAARWGAYVLVGFMDSGIPYVSPGHYLAHPAGRTSMMPTADDRPEYGAGSAGGDSYGPDDIDWEQVPAEITGDGAAPVPRIPTFTWADDNPAARAAYVAAYQEYWELGAGEAWWTGQRAEGSLIVNVDPSRPESRAAGSGAGQGWQDGQDFGLALRARETPKIERGRYSGAPYQHTAIHPDDDAADVDDGTDGAAVPAQSTGRDFSFEEHGVRILVREDGEVIVDTRAAGGVRVQASSSGVRLTASGAIVDVGKGGNVVDVRANDVRLHVDGEAAKSLVRGEVLDDFLAADFSVSTAFGPSGPSLKRFATSTVGAVLQAKAKVS